MHCDCGDGPSAPDTDEYNTVSKMFAALLAALNPSFPMFLVKMVESAAVFYSDPNTDKVGEAVNKWEKTEKNHNFFVPFQEKSGYMVAAILKQTDDPSHQSNDG